MTEDSKILRNLYEEIGSNRDVRGTASDFHLRELEIEFGLEYIRDQDTVLDVGCGPGVSLMSYATRREINSYGIDYASNMI